MKLKLASNSPRRLELLQQIGISPEVSPSQVNEELWDHQIPPELLVQKLAIAKAQDVYEPSFDGIILGADTIVLSQNEILEKPKDQADARRMLSLLSGNTHEVLTGIALLYENTIQSDVVRTNVTFRNLSEEEIDLYLQTDEWRDKAGGYGIQGRGALLASSIQGCYNNVVGLPISRLGEMLRELGMTI